MDLTPKGHVKQFNKRAYLKQKLRTNYGSQQEGHGRAFIQKKAVIRQYFRQQRREEERQRKKIQHQQLSRGEDEMGRLELHSKNDALMKKDTDEESLSPQGSRKKLNSWQRAKGEYRRKVAEKEQKKQEALKRRKEIEEAKRKYKEKRLQRYKKLNQKTKRGQPVMSGRIELMLEKLQEETKS